MTRNQDALDWSLPKSDPDGTPENPFEFEQVKQKLKLAALKIPSLCYALQAGLGRGDGLVALWQAWENQNQSQRLVIFVVEPAPLDRDTLSGHLVRLVGEQPAAQDFVEGFIEAYPLSLTRGWHCLDFFNNRVRVVLCFDQIHTVLSQLSGFFHVGLLPNQSKHEQALLTNENLQVQQILDLSAGTLTVSNTGSKYKQPKIRILGTGIAAASLASACLRRDIEVEIVDLRQGQRDASGNPLAIVEPRLTADLGPISRFNLQSFLFAVRFYDDLETGCEQTIWSTKGVHIWPSKAYPQKRLEKIASLLSIASPHWFKMQSEGWFLPTAGAVVPQAIIDASLPESAQFGLDSRSQDGLVSIYATGPQSFRSGFLAEITRSLIVSRGVVTGFEAKPMEGVHCGTGYVANLSPETILSGATFDRLDENPLEPSPSNSQDEDWRKIRDEDVEHNAAQAKILLQIAGNDGDELVPTNSRVSLRATTKDRWPIVGQISSNEDSKEAICTGFGSKGFTHAPLVADHLICDLIGEPGPMPHDLWQRMSPFRNL